MDLIKFCFVCSCYKIYIKHITYKNGSLNICLKIHQPFDLFCKIHFFKGKRKVVTISLLSDVAPDLHPCANTFFCNLSNLIAPKWLWPRFGYPYNKYKPLLNDLISFQLLPSFSWNSSAFILWKKTTDSFISCTIFNSIFTLAMRPLHVNGINE